VVDDAYSRQPHVASIDRLAGAALVEAAQHDDRAVVPLGNLAQLVEHAADFLVLVGVGVGEERGQRLDDDRLGPVLPDDAFDEVEVGRDFRRAFLVADRYVAQLDDALGVGAGGEQARLDGVLGAVLGTEQQDIADRPRYEMVSPAERAANPAFAQKIDPLRLAVKQERDFRKRLELRMQTQKNLVAIDADRFAWKANDHYEAHFGIVGFTTPSPVSDGKRVWVWCGNSVAACYDVDGTRRWMTRVDAGELSYSSAPALAGGTFAVYLHHLTGLDADTGKVRWKQKKVNANNAAILAACIAGVEVFVSSYGDVVRAADGKLLYREPDRVGGNSTWAPPVVVGDVVYLPHYGVKQFHVLDFAKATGDVWEPTRTSMYVPDGTGRLPNGKLADRSTCGSPLVVGGLAYLVDIYGTLYVYDLKAQKTLYIQDTDLEGLFHYNAVPVAASPTLVGKHIVIQDNQGAALVLEPGRTFRQVRKNHIGTQLERWWPVPAQETIGYSPPVPDGDRLYIRGERYLYCIGAR
jgi:outer membrane protein assembly factor BamB